MLRNSIPADKYCESVRDGTHDSPKPVLNNGKPLVTSKNLKDGQLDIANTYLISEEDFEKVNKRSKVDQWDVLISMIGTLGELHLVNHPPEYAIKNLGLFKTKSEYDGKWLYYFLKSPISKRYIEANSQGSTQQYLSLKTLREFPILLPNNELEKVAICNILSSIDEKIKLNQKINQTLEDTAKVVFNSWFVDFDPVRAKVKGKPIGLPDEISDLFPSEFVESELGEIPKGWQIKKLGDIALVALGGTPSRKNQNFWGGDIPWINSGEVNKFRIFEPSEFITQEGLENSSTKLLPKRTTVIAITGATLGQVSYLEIDTCANQSVVGITPLHEHAHEWLYFSIIFNIQTLINRQTGGAQQHINRNDVLDLDVLLPSQELLTSGDAIFEPIFEKIAINIREIKALTELRDVLLPKLISGELQITDAEKFLEEAGI